MPRQKRSQLRAVAEQNARGRTREIYDDIKQQLGVPLVSPVFQAYAVYPKFFEVFWSDMRPAVATAQFYALADRLRADAYTRMHNYFQVPDLTHAFTDDERGRRELQRMEEALDLFHYLDPLLLLILMALTQAFAKPAGHQPANAAPAEHPLFTDLPQLVTEHSAPAEVKAIYEDIKRTLGTQVLSSAYQAMGSMPAFLEGYWKALKPIGESALYTESHAGVRQTAWALAREFPARIEIPLENFLAEDEITGVARITEIFVESLSRTVLNVALAKIGLEHGTARIAAPSQSKPPQAA